MSEGPHRAGGYNQGSAGDPQPTGEVAGAGQDTPGHLRWPQVPTFGHLDAALGLRGP